LEVVKHNYLALNATKDKKSAFQNYTATPLSEVEFHQLVSIFKKSYELKFPDSNRFYGGRFIK
jgi:hypothetical protein